MRDKFPTQARDLEGRADTAAPGLRIFHAVLGMASEAGEAVDAVKKHLFYGKPLDKVNLVEEAGDMLWYLAILSLALEMPLAEIAQRNINKLQARYGEKFTAQGATVRDLDAERAVLEDDGRESQKDAHRAAAVLSVGVGDEMKQCEVCDLWAIPKGALAKVCTACAERALQEGDAATVLIAACPKCQKEDDVVAVLLADGSTFHCQACAHSFTPEDGDETRVVHPHAGMKSGAVEHTKHAGKSEIDEDEAPHSLYEPCVACNGMRVSVDITPRICSVCIASASSGHKD